MAYRSVDMNRNQKMVLEALEEIYPATNKQIAKHMGWEINSVTPRMLELRSEKLNKVVEAYKRKDVGGRLAIFWKPKQVNQDAADTY